MITQFIQDVCWGDLDYLIIDTPPGTSDEHITIAEILREEPVSAVVVTTPQVKIGYIFAQSLLFQLLQIYKLINLSPRFQCFFLIIRRLL